MKFEGLKQKLLIEYKTWTVKNDEIDQIIKKGSYATTPEELGEAVRTIEEKINTFLTQGLYRELMVEGDIIAETAKTNRESDQFRIQVKEYESGEKK